MAMREPSPITFDPADYGWVKDAEDADTITVYPGEWGLVTELLSDADIADLLRLTRLAKEAAGKTPDRYLALAVDTVLDDLGPALRRLLETE